MQRALDGAFLPSGAAAATAAAQPASSSSSASKRRATESPPAAVNALDSPDAVLTALQDLVDAGRLSSCLADEDRPGTPSPPTSPHSRVRPRLLVSLSQILSFFSQGGAQYGGAAPAFVFRDEDDDDDDDDGDDDDDDNNNDDDDDDE